MVIHGHKLDIVISEKIIPLVVIVSERIVEYEIGLWGISLNLLSDLSIEVLEDVKVRVPPWLIDWLEGLEGAVSTPSLEKAFRDIETPLEVTVVDVVHLAVNPRS